MNSITVATLLLVGVVCCYALPGGPLDADTNSVVIQRVANFAVSELGSEYTLDEVISAQTQVIGGLRTVITATVIKAGQVEEDPTCTDIGIFARRGRTTNAPQNTDETLTCELTVEARIWEGYRELVDFECTPV